MTEIDFSSIEVQPYFEICARRGYAVQPLGLAATRDPVLACAGSVALHGCARLLRHGACVQAVGAA